MATRLVGIPSRSASPMVALRTVCMHTSGGSGRRFPAVRPGNSTRSTTTPRPRSSRSIATREGWSRPALAPGVSTRPAGAEPVTAPSCSTLERGSVAGPNSPEKMEEWWSAEHRSRRRRVPPARGPERKARRGLDAALARAPGSCRRSDRPPPSPEWGCLAGRVRHAHRCGQGRSWRRGRGRRTRGSCARCLAHRRYPLW